MRILLTVVLISLLTQIQIPQTLTDKTPWFPPYELNSISFIDDNTGWMTSEENKLMKSTDGGTTWNEFSTTPSLNKLFAFSETNLIGRGTFGKSYYSDNGGLNWTEITYPAGYDIEIIYAVDFNTIYAAGKNETILKSTDRGQSWQVLNYNPDSPTRFRIIYSLDYNYGWAAAYDTTTYENKIYKTSDAGTTWTLFGNSVYADDIQFADSLNGYAVNNSAIYKTTDGGNNWTSFYSVNQDPFVALKVTHDNKIYISKGLNCNANGSANLILSTDGGFSWATTNIENYDFRINGIEVLANGNVVICGEKGYVGKTYEWNKFEVLNGEWIYKVFSLPDRVYAQGRFNFYKITNHGNTWEKMDYYFGSGMYNIYFLDTLNGFGFGNYNYVYRTSDGGYNWSVLNQLPDKLVSSAGRNLFVSNNTGLYRTSDYGESWQLYNITDISYIHFLDTIFGWLISNNTLYKTTNSGLNWEAVAQVPSHVDGIKFFSPDSGWALDRSYEYYTSNGGITWNIYKTHDFFRVSEGKIKLRDIGSWCYLEIDQYLPCDETIYRVDLFSKDGQSNYAFNCTGKWSSNFHFYDDDHGWLAGGRRLYFIDYEKITTASDEKPTKYVPTEFYLAQNYPNPFNPTTTIKYSVPVQAKVELRVIDVLGNVVKVLVNEERAPGEYETIFNAGSLASGIYFYTLKAGSYSTTKKLLLLK